MSEETSDYSISMASFKQPNDCSSRNSAVIVTTKDSSFIGDITESSNVSRSVILQRKRLERTAPPIVTCQFNVVRQYHTFSKTFPRSTTVQSVRDDICSTFMIEATKLVMINNRLMVNGDTPLANLKMDDVGNIEIKIFTNDGTKLRLALLHKDMAPITYILPVTVGEADSFMIINIQVIDAKMIKPYLGGYRNKNTGKEFHHAFSQTPQRKERVPADMKNNRDTQTVSVRTKNVDTSLTYGTQMYFQGVYVPCASDVIITPKPYETYAEMMARINPHLKATIIQRAWRSYFFRKAVSDWLERCKQRIADLKNEELNDRIAREFLLKQEIVRNTFPQTRQDFDQLYAMVDSWKKSEITRLSKSYTGGPKIAECYLPILEKETEMLRSMEKFRAEFREDNRILKEKRLLETMSSPVVWKTEKGLRVSMDTLEAQHSRYLKDLYYSFCKTDIKFEERMKLLINFKSILQDYKCPLEEQLTSLIDRECDLMVRNFSNKDLEVLRKRILSMVLKFIHLPQFNRGGMRRIDLKKQNGMKDERLYNCKECGQVKTYKDFPLSAETADMLVCTSCSWLNSSKNKRSEMLFFSYILRAIRREERRKRCWSSLAFILENNDIYYIVEKIWHSRSAMSEVTDLNDLRLCRWKNNKDWAPWNCILLTTKEVKAHIKLENDPEQIYDANLVQKVLSKHLLARVHFSSLAGANDGDDEDLYSLPTTRASSISVSV